MATVTIQELKDAIVSAVGTLDESDGSRVSTAAAIDEARSILGEAYGPSFEKDVEEYLSLPVEDDLDGDGIPDDEEEGD